MGPARLAANFEGRKDHVPRLVKVFHFPELGIMAPRTALEIGKARWRLSVVGGAGGERLVLYVAVTHAMHWSIKDRALIATRRGGVVLRVVTGLGQTGDIAPSPTTRPPLDDAASKSWTGLCAPLRHQSRQACDYLRSKLANRWEGSASRRWRRRRLGARLGFIDDKLRIVASEGLGRRGFGERRWGSASAAGSRTMMPRRPRHASETRTRRPALARRSAGPFSAPPAAGNESAGRNDQGRHPFDLASASIAAADFDRTRN